MKNTKHTAYPAFTLLELLAVLVILVALFAILFRTIQGQLTQANIKTATLQVKGFQESLERFRLDRGSYPSTEQGLNSLIYIPSNEMRQQPGMQQPGMQPGAMPGADPMAMPVDPMGGAPVGATATGTSALNTPNPADPMGMGGMQPGAPGAADPFAMPGAAAPGMDPMGGMGSMDGMDGMGAATGTGMSTYTQTVYNPQLYTTMVKRNPPYLENDTGEIPLDPWGQPYHYVYSPVITAQGVVNPLTGEDKPAIWSNGPDKTEGTADDIRNWNPANVQATAPMGQPGADPMNPMGAGGGMQPDPFGTMQPGQPGMPMQPGMSVQPGMPMQPGMPTDGGAAPSPFGAPQPNMTPASPFGTQPPGIPAPPAPEMTPTPPPM